MHCTLGVLANAQNAGVTESFRHVAMIALPLSILVTCDDRNENNSVLFSLIRRNACQLGNYA